MNRRSISGGPASGGPVLRRGPARPRGVAILMSLVVLMLLSMFMREVLFSTVLAVPSLSNYPYALHRAPRPSAASLVVPTCSRLSD